MKKFFKITFSALGIILLCMMIFGQIAKTAMKPAMEKESQCSEFARMIERADRDCPIPVAMGKGAVTGIKLESGFVTYYLSYEPGFSNVLSKVQNDEKVKEGLLMSILCINAQGRNQGDYLSDILIRFNYGLRIVITESTFGKFECSVPANEIKTFRERYNLNPQEALYSLIKLNLETERENLPMVIDEGMLMTDLKLEGGNITYVIQIDENYYSIEEMNANKDLIKESMIDTALSDPDNRSLLDLCKVSHTGLIYRMYGNRSNKKFEVEITSSEIRRIVPTPPNVNIN